MVHLLPFGSRLQCPNRLANLPAKTFATRAAHTVRCATVGIDLGTTNSAIAIVRNGKPCIVTVGDASVIPSVVAYSSAHGVLVGQEAVEQQPCNARNTFSSVKRLIGRKFAEVRQDRGLVYKLVSGEQGEAALLCSVLERAILPEEVSSHIIRRLLQAASRMLDDDISGAVITVPVAFNAEQRAATVQAARLAGLTDIQLLQEPVAAALAYGLVGAHLHDTILVLDIGGGTFDTSLLASFEGVVEVLGSAGDPWLGGGDLDAALVQWLLSEQLPEKVAEAVRSNESALASLYRAAESAKIALSSINNTEVHMGDVLTGVDVSVPVSHDMLQHVISPLMQRVATPLEEMAHETFLQWKESPSSVLRGGGCTGQASQESQYTLGSHDKYNNKYAAPMRTVSQAILVGGATRMPAVRDLVHRITGVCPRGDVDPEQCVALGAAVQAGMMTGEIGALEVMDGLYSADQHDRVSGFMGVQ